MSGGGSSGLLLSTLGTGAPVAEVFTPTLMAHMVEQGPAGTPSWTGIVHLLEQIASGAVPARPQGKAPTATPPTIKSVVRDVLLTSAESLYPSSSSIWKH